MIVYYEDYETNFDKSKKRLLEYLELPDIGYKAEHIGGKRYSDYYTNEQRKAIWDFLRIEADDATWSLIQRYDEFPDDQLKETVETRRFGNLYELLDKTEMK